MTMSNHRTATATARDAADLSSAVAAYSCHVHALVGQYQDGNRRPWIVAAVETLGHEPTDADVDRVEDRRREFRAYERATAATAYRALVESGQAFQVIDHSDRLASRPFEITLAEPLSTATPSVTAHGSSLRLARYGSRGAAERALAKLTAKERERLADAPDVERPTIDADVLAALDLALERAQEWPEKAARLADLRARIA